MRISLIVPTYKRHNDLPRLLDSVLNQYSFIEEVLIVVGPGDFQSLDIIEEWQAKIPSIRMVQATKASLIHSLNTGLSIAKEEIICLTDDDVFLPPDWSQKIRNTFSSQPHVGAYGGRDRLQLVGEPALSNPPLAPLVGTFAGFGKLVGNHHCGCIESPVSVDVLKGCNLSFRRSAFKKMRIEPSLEFGGAEPCSEIDICLQIKKAGHKVIYDNENYVLHYASPRLDSDNRTDLFSKAWAKRTYNEALVIAKLRSLGEAGLYMLRIFFKGSRFTPGLAWAIGLFPKYGFKVLKLPWIYMYANIKGIQKGYELRN